MNFQWSAFLGAFPYLIQGARVTVLVALASLPVGLVLGAIVGIVLTYAPRILKIIAQIYVGLIRGTPMVVQIMFVYFAFPVLLDIRMDGLTAGTLALVINSSAYMAEIVRGGIASVPRGLQEAGLAMGLPLRKVIFYIIGPIAFRRMIPALGNQFIIGLKDTSLLITIGVGELTRTGQEIMTDSYRAVEVWLAVAIIYLAIISGFAILVRRLETWIRIA